MTLGTSRAVLVGVTSTKDISYAPLPSAEHDVYQLERTLEVHRDGATQNFGVTSVIVNETDPWAVSDLLDVVDRELSAAEHFLFYFSGHGDVTDYGLQLITPEKEHPLDSGVYFDTLLHRFNRATNVEITIILDCCFSGGAGDISGHTALRPFTQLRDGISILASSGRNAKSYSSSDTDPSDFTSKVVDCLDQNGPPTDVLDIYRWTRDSLQDQTPVLRTFGSQHSAIRADS